MPSGFGLGKNTKQKQCCFYSPNTLTTNFQRHLGIKKKSILSHEIQKSSPYFSKWCLPVIPVLVHMPTLAFWNCWALCRIHTVSHAYNLSLGFNNKAGISNCFDNSKSYDSLSRGYYHYYVAHLIKALRDEGAVLGSNGLVSVNINWAICGNPVQKRLHLLSIQARSLLELPHRMRSVDMFGGLSFHILYHFQAYYC